MKWNGKTNRPEIKFSKQITNVWVAMISIRFPRCAGVHKLRVTVVRGGTVVLVVEETRFGGGGQRKSQNVVQRRFQRGMTGPAVVNILTAQIPQNPGKKRGKITKKIQG